MITNRKLITSWGVILATAVSATWAVKNTEAQTSTDIACTETPDCSALGYTKNSSDCPDGGIKCPFDDRKMFCVSGEAIDFQFQNELNLYDIVYSDGTTSQTYNANKLAIGLVAYVHPNGKKNHGLMISLDQPPAQTRAEAIKRCSGYVTKGTKSSNWHLPDMAELMMISSGNDASNEYTNLINALNKVPGANRLGRSYTESYCLSGTADYNKTYLNAAPACSSYNKSGTCTATGSTSGSCTVNGSTSGTCTGSLVPGRCPSGTSQQSGCPNVGSITMRCYKDNTGAMTQVPCYSAGECTVTKSYSKSCTVNKNYSKQCTATIAVDGTNRLEDTVYWSISDNPTTSGNWLYANLNSTTGWAEGGSLSAKYGHYRCVASF